jgi:hypothetical protein
MNSLHIWKANYKFVSRGSTTDTVIKIDDEIVITKSIDAGEVFNTIKNFVELKSAQYEFIQLTKLEYIGKSEIIEE